MSFGVIPLHCSKILSAGSLISGRSSLYHGVSVLTRQLGGKFSFLSIAILLDIVLGQQSQAR